MLNAIKYLYPTAKPLIDFTLQDNSDGVGVRITFWDEDKLGPEPTIEQLTATTLEAEAVLEREQRELDIDSQRDEKLSAGVEWNGELWYTDDVFQGQITARVAGWNAGIFPADATKPVRSKAGPVHMLTFDQHKALSLALFDYVEGVYGWSWAAKAQLNAEPEPVVPT